MSSFLTLPNLSAATPDGRPLFHDLTLSVGAERNGLVGRNGSGKSTLLHIVAGDARPASGTVDRPAQLWQGGDSVVPALTVHRQLSILTRIEAGDGTTADFDAADRVLPAAINGALPMVGHDTRVLNAIGIEPSVAVASIKEDATAPKPG